MSKTRRVPKPLMEEVAEQAAHNGAGEVVDAVQKVNPARLNAGISYFGQGLIAFSWTVVSATVSINRFQKAWEAFKDAKP
jgi:hypothetical protein